MHTASGSTAREGDTRDRWREGDALAPSTVDTEAPVKQGAVLALSGVEGDHLLFEPLMKIWLSSRPFHALDATVWLEDGPKKGRTVEEVAGAYVNHILGSHAAGPAILLGHGTGGVLAWETARQLSALGHPVAGLILIDTFEPLTGANADGFFARGFQRYGKAPFSRIWRLGRLCADPSAYAGISLSLRVWGDRFPWSGVGAPGDGGTYGDPAPVLAH